MDNTCEQLGSFSKDKETIYIVIFKAKWKCYKEENAVSEKKINTAKKTIIMLKQ